MVYKHAVSQLAGGGKMPDYIFRSRQRVQWSQYAFDRLGESWLKSNYGLQSFLVVSTVPVKKADRAQVGHKQLVTINCDGNCQIPVINSAKAGECKGNCLITFPGKFFKPARNGVAGKCRKASK